jgi:hypothetical protein
MQIEKPAGISHSQILTLIQGFGVRDLVVQFSYGLVKVFLVNVHGNIVVVEEDIHANIGVPVQVLCLVNGVQPVDQLLDLPRILQHRQPCRLIIVEIDDHSRLIAGAR